LPYTGWPLESASGFFLWQSDTDPEYVEFYFDPEIIDPNVGTRSFNAVTFQYCSQADSNNDGVLDGHEADDGVDGSVHLRPGWFLFGDKDDLVRMSDQGRAWIVCDWYDAASDSCDWSAGGGCGMRVDIAADWTLTPAGNMAGFSADSAGCF
jgi:hypothetical protein